MHRMVRCFAIEFKRWESKRLLPRRGHPGRTPMSSASSVRSATNVWTTSSFSTSATCVASCRVTLNIITRPELIFRSTRIAHHLAAYGLHHQARSSHSRKWAVCIIATNAAPPDLEVGEPARPYFDLKDLWIFRHIARTKRCAEIPVHSASVVDAPM